MLFHRHTAILAEREANADGFHAMQLALTGPLALSVLLLADSFGRANTWINRLGIGAFLVFFSAYETVAGIGTGLAMRSARDLWAIQQKGVFNVVQDWPAFGPPVALSIIGTLGWVVAVGALALAARRQGCATTRMDPYRIGSGVPSGWASLPNSGPAAFGCLLIAAVLHEFRPVGQQ